MITKQIHLTCDLCNVEYGTDWFIVRLRANAKEEGWAYSRGKDICPNCRQRKPKGWTDENWSQIKGDAPESNQQ